MEQLTGGRRNSRRLEVPRTRHPGGAFFAWRRARLSPLTLFILCSAPPASAQETAGETPPLAFASTTAEDLRTRITSADDRILILTPAALYRFQPESEAWTVTTTGDGLPETPLGNLTAAGGRLWISGIGTSVSDLRFDDWERYGSGEGYPGRVVFDVEADEDYAYGGTDGGGARFDQFILEWETIRGPPGETLGPVRDVAVGEDRVWFGLERGVAEYRKETESTRVDSLLGQLRSPRVLALRRGSRFLWALTETGIARYDTELRSWISFQPGIDLPQARVHQFSLEGEDLWLGTDAGLWSYHADAAIWRRHESADEMPGEMVRAFVLRSARIWVVTERAFAVYDEEASRWVDFTSSVPLAPSAVSEMAWIGETLVFLGRDEIVYGLSRGLDNPNLFTYRTRPILRLEGDGAAAADRGWQLGLDDEGLSIRRPEELALHVKGGATTFIENVLGPGERTGFGELVSETRLDLRLNGQLAEDRSLSGFYDSTDPDNTSYQLTYRGSRSGTLRLLSFGEIDQQLFNSNLVPGAGITGARVWSEAGPRTEQHRRRLFAADAWAGERRTFPGRDTFLGGNRTVENQTRDVDYVRGQVFPLPAGWTADDLRSATYYFDDDDPATDDANTERRTIAGRAGAWDRLLPNADYVIGPGGETLITATPVQGDRALVAVGGELLPPDRREVDLTDLWLRNHYLIATDPVPGTLVVTMIDSTGASTDGSGASYLETFGLDRNGDGMLDAERFSPISGLVDFPDERPFPPEVYADDPTTLFALVYSYRASLNTFQLSHRFLVPRSERIAVDRDLLKPDVDYSIIPTSGLFILFEHVLLDDDSVIEVEYLYEIDEGSDLDQGTLAAGQIAVAPDDRIYLGVNGSRWSHDGGADQTTVGVNTRLEWKDEERLLRVSPELAFSKNDPATAGPGDGRSEPASGQARGISLQARHRGLEASASHRNLDQDFVSFEDRRTLLGRLREESYARGLAHLGSYVQLELDWDKVRSDQVTGLDVAGSGSGAGTGAGSGAGAGSDSLASGWGEESSLSGAFRLLRSGWPNVEFRRGRIQFETPGLRQEKDFSRVDLELSPEQAGLVPLGIHRLWARAFFQRSDRTLSGEDAAGGGDSLGAVSDEEQTTDHAFLRLNGAVGAPLSWNLSFEHRNTFLPERADRDLRRLQAVDATVQTQPHSSLDALFRWEASNDRFWHPDGGSGGFNDRRLRLATIQFYPGRLQSRMSRVSFRFDAGLNDTEAGEPGVALPGIGSLWSAPDDVSKGRKFRYEIIETRVEVLSGLRLVERLEFESDRNTREDLETERDSRRLESRLEMRPNRGLVIVRVIGARSEDEGGEDDEKRLSSQWDQTWGRGILTYASLEAQENETRDRLVGERTQLLNPLVRITWRRARWQLDASVGGSLTWIRTRDTSVGTSRGWSTTRQRSLATTLSMHPLRLLGLKLQYVLSRSEVEEEIGASGSGDDWETTHDLRIQLQIRA